ncbi:MAG: ABC transporter substrate-binding protein [Actinobacteria bacterium]|nr:ABC transporter substrate-binding protein [Actinomycetota bacterium]
MLHRRPARLAGSALLLVVLALSAVSGAARTATAPKPLFGGTLVVAAGDPAVLNPAITSSGQAHPVTGQIFNGLIRLDRYFRARPDLARTWKISADGRTYTFNLAENVRWHDGVAFTSADVKFTYEEILLKLHPRTRTLADVIERISAPSRNVVVFRLKHRYAPFLSWLDEDNGAILPKHLYEGTDPLRNPVNLKPIGTGPFKLESYNPGDRVVLVRNPAYFKAGLPRLDRLVFRVMGSAQAAQAFEAGEVDVYMFPSGPDALRFLNRPGITVTERGREGSARVVPLILNNKRSPFDDVRVRRAMAYALDTDFIARTAYAGVLRPAKSPLTRFIPWAYTAKIQQYPHNPARANAILDEVGLRRGTNGTRFRTSLIFDAGFSRQAELIKAQLGEVGIVVDLRLMEMNTWVQRLYIQKDFDMGYTNYTHPADPDVGWKRIYVCSNIVAAPFTNGASYCNQEVDRLFDEAAAELDEKKRGDIYKRLQRILASDVPVIPIADGIGPWIFRSSEFRGFGNAGSKEQFAFGEQVWWTKGAVRRG